MAATTVFEASVVRENGRLNSGNASTGALHNLSFRLSKAFGARDPKWMVGSSSSLMWAASLLLRNCPQVFDRTKSNPRMLERPYRSWGEGSFTRPLSYLVRLRLLPIARSLCNLPVGCANTHLPWCKLRLPDRIFAVHFPISEHVLALILKKW
jgi:hypothetical protein